MGENMAEDLKTSVENFNTDAQTAEEVVNGNESGKVVARLGREYPTLPAAIQRILDMGGMDAFATESALKASIPTTSTKIAYAADTQKIWRWASTSEEGVTPITGTWTDTGKSPIDQAKADATAKAKAAEDIAKTYTDTRFADIVALKTSDIFLLINKIAQAYINALGAQTASTNWACSGFFPVKYRDVIDYSATTNNLASTIAAYDANKNFLRHLVSLAPNSTLVAKTGSVEIPADVKFVRVSYYSANSTAYSFMYKPFQIETDLLNRKEVSESVWSEITAKPNLFNPSTASDNLVLLNNVLTSSGTWFVSDFIPVTPNEYYTTNGTAGGSASAGIHYYDANKTFINYGGKNVAGVPFLIPLGTAFIRVNYTKSSSQTIADTVLSQGKVAEKYGPLEDKIIEIAGDNGSGNQKYSGMTLMTMGDSITYGSTTPWTYPSKVAASLGMILNNVGASGTRIRYAFTKTTPESLLEANIITIAYGTNDFKIETPLGVISDTPTPRSLLDDPTYKANESTAGSFYADYKGVIEGIFAANPNARVMLITPIRRTQAAGTGTDTNSRGHKLIDYVNAVKEIAQYYSLPVLDNYNTSGFNQVTMPVWLSDGLHPTEWAQQNVMAPKISGFIESN